MEPRNILQNSHEAKAGHNVVPTMISNLGPGLEKVKTKLASDAAHIYFQKPSIMSRSISLFATKLLHAHPTAKQPLTSTVLLERSLLIMANPSKSQHEYLDHSAKQTILHGDATDPTPQT